MQHNYLLSDLSAGLNKAASTLSEIISLNKLPDDVKIDSLDPVLLNPAQKEALVAALTTLRGSADQKLALLMLQ